MDPPSETSSIVDFEEIDSQFFSSAPPPAVHSAPPAEDFTDLDARAVAPASPELRARRARLRRWAVRVVAAASLATVVLAVRGAIVWLSPPRTAGAATAVASIETFPAVAAEPSRIAPPPVAEEPPVAELPRAVEPPPSPDLARPAAPSRAPKKVVDRPQRRDRKVFLKKGARGRGP
jgi:hypothetical protein